MSKEIEKKVSALAERVQKVEKGLLESYKKIESLEQVLGGKMDKLLLSFSNLLLRLSSIEKISENATEIAALKSMYTNLEGRFSKFKTDFIASCEKDIDKNQNTIEKVFDHLKH